MSLHLYNTFTKREEEFAPRERGRVTMYSCGPTVYSRPHIGNYSSFILADLVRRWLEVSGFTVEHVKNITDVGHLVRDADRGEDKIQKEAEKEKVDPLEIAGRYADQYLEDEKSLNLLEPTKRPRATEYIKEMLSIIRTLIEKGNAYELPDGIYFSIATFPQYGALSGNSIDGLKKGARIDIDDRKKHPADFALWKKCVGENVSHILRWSFETGERTHTTGEDSSAGFPGWHIECSAMASAILGEQIDLHTGGEDNIFPHHECEIAQSECAFGKKPFVRMWLHKRRIDLKGEKMSKSIGNVLTIPDVESRGFSPLDLKYLFLSVHYRTNLKFSWKGLEDAKKAREKIVEWRRDVQSIASTDQNASSDPLIAVATEGFTASMNEDLNTPKALAHVFSLVHAVYAALDSGKKFSSSDQTALQNFSETLERTFGCFEISDVSVPDRVKKLLDERATARKEKDFAASDRLRDEILSLGFIVRDTDQGQVVRPK